MYFIEEILVQDELIYIFILLNLLLKKQIDCCLYIEIVYFVFFYYLVVSKIIFIFVDILYRLFSMYQVIESIWKIICFKCLENFDVFEYYCIFCYMQLLKLRIYFW